MLNYFCPHHYSYVWCCNWVCLSLSLVLTGYVTPDGLCDSWWSMLVLIISVLCVYVGPYSLCDSWWSMWLLMVYVGPDYLGLVCLVCLCGSLQSMWLLMVYVTPDGLCWFWLSRSCVSMWGLTVYDQCVALLCILSVYCVCPMCVSNRAPRLLYCSAACKLDQCMSLLQCRFPLDRWRGTSTVWRLRWTVCSCRGCQNSTRLTPPLPSGNRSLYSFNGTSFYSSLSSLHQIHW